MPWSSCDQEERMGGAEFDTSSIICGGLGTIKIPELSLTSNNGQDLPPEESGSLDTLRKISPIKQGILSHHDFIPQQRVSSFIIVWPYHIHGQKMFTPDSQGWKQLGGMMPSKRLSNVTQIVVLSSDIHDPSPRPLEPEVTTMKMRRLWSGRNNSLNQRDNPIACAKERRESGESALADRPRGIFSLALKKMITKDRKIAAEAAIGLAIVSSIHRNRK
uniref:Uncharacterized protein n=1 Tax=Ananas comosus var. bracteatus TaxID=296719 RepID=A0A6V7PYE5_ANACO|nr:unnamed protein product [Ananas comosus var. bracteatus]